MEFSEKFKTFSNAELLNILSNPHRYQEKALNTAKEILDNRSLSEEEMRIAKEELEAVQRKQLQKEERKKEIERKIKGIGQTIADNLNPVQKEALTTEKIIKTVSVTCFILCLFYLYNEFDMIRFMLSDSTAHWDLPTMASFLPLIILLIASILFYKRKKAGWLLLKIFLSYSLVSGIASIVFAIKWNWPIYTLLCTILVFTGLIYTINRKNVRAFFSINKQDSILAFSITAIITGFIAYLYA
ncbi:MAG: hypothetical protein JNM21_06480 [Taibaiella sp.]|nr:hypothetical protein [Taibaiella sp.]